MGFSLAFMIISAVNGIVIRVALICSNVILVPLMFLLKFFGVRSDENTTSHIYHSMGLIGAQMAHYDN